METAPLKSLATWARTALIREVTARIASALAPGSPELIEQAKAVAALEKAVGTASGGEQGRAAVADKVAYIWFNRIIALRFMDANGYTGIGVVSPQAGVELGQPEILAEAKRGVIDAEVVSDTTRKAVIGLLDGTRTSGDPQGEAYALLLTDYCRHWNKAMPFMFEREGDFTELLIPANLLADDSVLNRSVKVLTQDVCKDVEVIGWLYQFYISERKDEVFAGFRRNKKAGAHEIPAATQLFTPHWIVRYLVENSLGRLWMLNHPSSRLVDQMDYYIAPIEEEPEFLKITMPEELKVIDPACGSGHMLTYSFDLLEAIYVEEGYAPSEIPGLILANNLYGTEIDPRAGALAAFALTMKAVAKRKLFLKNPVQPRICVLDPISFSSDELDFLVTKDGEKYAEEAFWNQFARADTLGSLIQPDPELTARLARHLATLDGDGDMLRADVLDRAHQVVTKAEYLVPRYAAVVANPPYMGSKNMDARLSEFAKTNFKESRSDLFAMFVERCLNLVPWGGFTGFMTPFVWMFIASYEALRKRIIQCETITTLVQLEYSGFDGATVPICAYVLRRGSSDVAGAFVRLSDFVGPAVQGAKTLEIIQSDRERLAETTASGMQRHLYRIPTSDFAKVPGSPIAYWLSDAMRAAFMMGDALGEVAAPRNGLSTSDNARFLRMWWEPSRSRVLVDCPSGEAARQSGSRWFPYNKGGEFRRWSGNQLYVVNWERDGSEVKDFITERYPYLNGNPGIKVRSTESYFLPHLSWSRISSGPPAFRVYGSGFLFDDAGPASFPSTSDERCGIAGIMNSSVATALISAVAPTLNFMVGDIAKMPINRSLLTTAYARRVDVLVSESQMDWDDFETSWNFGSLSLLRESSSGSLRQRLAEWSLRQAGIASEQQARETENNRIVADTYRLQDEVPIEVPLHRVSLTRNAQFRYGPGKSPAEYEELERKDLAVEVVSYAVGCTFGRYSLDEPGLILADQGATLEDYLAKVPSPSFVPDDDNVIPIVDGDWFEGDVVGLFREFLRTAFGEGHFEENLAFVTESLGVKNLRDYFITKAGRSKFYDDHVQRYKKRPIYWLFSSPNGSFNALIYMHRYMPSTVSTVLNEYLREFQAKLRASLDHAERDNNAKEADRLRNMLLELDAYEHDVLYPLATQNIAIDLDDGVKANYLKFGAALKKIPGLEASE